MPRSRSAFSALFIAITLCGAASASPLTVKVTDPQHAMVPNARVTVLPANSQKPVTIVSTDALGTVTIDVPGGDYIVSVLAPGFAPASVTAHVPGEQPTLQLAIAPPDETVNVTSADTLATTNETAAQGDVLDARDLTTRNPVVLSDAIRYLPGAIVAGNGTRGALTSLFVRGGDSRYNKVLIDGVPVNDPGGVFDFGVVPLTQVNRVEFIRGAQGALYGSDAMTSVLQLFTATGHTPKPEFTLDAEGGNYSTARGYAAVGGAYKRADYNFFGEQLHTNGNSANDEYSNAAQGANIGFSLAPHVSLRARVRHSNSRSGVPGVTVFNGVPFFPPDQDQHARTNELLGSLELRISAPERWIHTLRGFDYTLHRANADNVADRGCDVLNFNFFDCYFDARAHVTRAGFDYQGEYTPRSWARSIFGYEFEDEHGSFNTRFADADFVNLVPTVSTSEINGLRRNHAVFGEELLAFSRVNLSGGLRYVHNESFGNRAVPQASISVLAFKGNDRFTGTRLRFAYGTGIKEPRFEESFGITGTYLTLPNPKLRAERNRSFETGVTQNFGAKASLVATYFHNDFTDQIAFNCDPVTFECSYINLGKALAHGAEVGFHVRANQRITADLNYVYTSAQILKAAVGATGINAVGSPLLRRPKDAVNLVTQYAGDRWGGSFSAGYVGRRADSDFFTLPTPVNFVRGYTRADASAWYQVNRWATAYINGDNIFNRHYEEVLGYPALGASFRAGLRFRLGGE